MFGKKKFTYTKEDVCFLAFTETIAPGVQGFNVVRMANTTNCCSVFDTPNLKRYLSLNKVNAQSALALPVNFSQAPNEKDVVLIEKLRIVKGRETLCIVDTEEIGLAAYVSIKDAKNNGWL